jgi:hypothetical protein
METKDSDIRGYGFLFSNQKKQTHAGPTVALIRGHSYTCMVCMRVFICV